MVLSTPSMVFNPTGPIAIGEIDVGSSSAKATYHIKHSVGVASVSMASMANMSISFEGSVNASEAKDEKWLYISTAIEDDSVGSIGSSECAAPSVVQDGSTRVAYIVKVPAGASTSGAVYFKFHHRYQRNLAYVQ